MSDTNNKQYLGTLLLLLTSLIWGSAFVAQKSGMDHIGPCTFQSLRSVLGFLTVLPVYLFRRRQSAGSTSGRPSAKRTLWAGLCCGLAFTGGSLLQQIALQSTDVGKAGFLTSVYIVLVPLFSVFMGKKISRKIWFCELLALAGVYVLSGGSLSGFGKGEFLLLGAAVGFALQILSVDYFVQEVDGVVISLLQLLTAAVLSGIPMIFLEHPQMDDILQGIIPLLYAGVMSSGIAYSLQILGQKYAEPSQATILMSTESVFALAGGVLILHQPLILMEVIGGGMILTAVILTQLPDPDRKEIQEGEKRVCQKL